MLTLCSVERILGLQEMKPCADDNLISAKTMGFENEEVENMVEREKMHFLLSSTVFKKLFHDSVTSC